MWIQSKHIDNRIDTRITNKQRYRREKKYVDRDSCMLSLWYAFCMWCIGGGDRYIHSFFTYSLEFQRVITNQCILFFSLSLFRFVPVDESKIQLINIDIFVEWTQMIYSVAINGRNIFFLCLSKTNMSPIHIFLFFLIVFSLLQMSWIREQKGLMKFVAKWIARRRIAIKVTRISVKWISITVQFRNVCFIWNEIRKTKIFNVVGLPSLIHIRYGIHFYVLWWLNMFVFGTVSQAIFFSNKFRVVLCYRWNWFRCDLISINRPFWLSH